MKRLIITVRSIALSTILFPLCHAQSGVPNPPVLTRVRIPTDIPDLDPNPDFPLRFHILVARIGGGFDSQFHGYGSANLTDPAARQTAPAGFNFAFDCAVRFLVNTNPTENYQARWKKIPYELEILTLDRDTSEVHTCVLRLAHELQPFDISNTIRYMNTIPRSPRQRWTDPDFAYEVADPRYPIQFHVADGGRNEDGPTDTGDGIANVADPSTHTPLQGASYQYDCEHGFLNNSQAQNYYQGRWIKPGEKLEILLQRPGTDKVDKCIVHVSLEAQTYQDRWPLSRPNTPVLPRNTPGPQYEHPNAPTTNYPEITDTPPPNR